MKACIRPLPVPNGTSGRLATRDQLRAGDTARCLCGQPNCRDSDLKT